MLLLLSLYKEVEMIKLEHISKSYYDKKNPSKTVNALKDISITFPKQGFISILGPSGCGKTTLLNILGGLDTRYEGNLIVNDVNTKTFRGNDWDSYRNSHVGFVFQEYNLIPHQNVSQNVELAPTIAGASKIEAKENSKKMLEYMDLQDKITQKTNTLSGGQKQRVAIARALVNNPEMILADEPTSALDTKTSQQVMEILKEISKNKLVIMVTHNIDLAKKYSSKIVNILDGKIQSVEDLENEEEKKKEEFLEKMPQNYKYGKSKMKFKTALNLSFKSLMTRKRRTFLTTIAGSIGIICLSVILGIYNGASDFAKDMSNKALTNRPIRISSRRNYSSEEYRQYKKQKKEYEKEYRKLEKEARTSTKISNPEKKQEKLNEELKRMAAKKNKNYFNNLSSEYQQFILNMQDQNPDAIRAIAINRNPNAIFVAKKDGKYFNMGDNFAEMPYVKDISKYYDLVGNKGKWPQAKDEVVVTLDSANNLNRNVLAALGLDKRDDIDVEEVIGKTLATFVPLDNAYKKVEDSYHFVSPEELKSLCENGVENGVKLKIVGVVKEKGKEENGLVKELSRFYMKTPILSEAVIYSRELGDYIYQNNQNSQLCKLQNSVDYSILTGPGEKAKTSDDIMNFYQNFYSGSGGKTKEEFLMDLGVSKSASRIYIYLDNVEKYKEDIFKMLNGYNENKADKDQIQIPELSDMESMVLTLQSICFALLLTIGLASLLTSLIMISLLTFISVLERTKEIGVLRSIGARKKDISRLFKSETLIIGFFTGIFGVAVGQGLSVIINNWLANKAEVSKLNLVKIDIKVWLGLLAFSLLTTVLAGVIPAKIASRKDPVKILTGTNN